MPTPELSQPITKPGGLKRLADILADQPIVAVDTESNSLFAYHEQVCLIQFSTPEADYLLDPLGFGDLA
jgi:ribonuclease D